MTMTNVQIDSKEEVTKQSSDIKHQLTLIRGLPGIGKTTLAHSLMRGVCVVIAADDFMVDDDGQYLHDPKRLTECHEACRDAVESAMGDDIKQIIVHNTFSQRWEMEPYLRLVAPPDMTDMMIPGGPPCFPHYGLQVIALSNELSVSQLAERTKGTGNGHCVPIDAIKGMQSRWEYDWANADPRPPRKRPKSEVIDASNFVRFMVERSSTLDMFDVMESPLTSWSFPSTGKGWTTRALNLFTVNKIKTIGELVQLSENDLGRMPQMGRATLHEITDRLAEFGLYLVDSVAHKVASKQK